MYDTIRMNLNILSGQGLTASAPKYLSNAKESKTKFGEPYISGYLDNMFVLCKRSNVYICNSLCKYYFGNNFETLNRKSTRLAIDKLSDCLHLPIKNADVNRLDVAQNIIIKHSPDVYFNHLGNLNYYKRLLQPNGVQYTNGDKQILFYDKNAEAQSKREKIPDLYQGRHVLRVEKRFTQHIKKQFKLPSITADILSDEKFYISVVTDWRETYKAINKINDITLNFDIMKGKKELQTAGLLLLIQQQGGEAAIIEQINEAFKIGKITKKQKFDLKTAIVNACKIGGVGVTQSEAINELNTKINEAAKFYR